ncbi:hypothetical protein PybrP1_010362 [[Pythium] brassicae (nom. inval.)]|nr:hypothetical protein PybrP1_010362 [[Pythium] brassicae (nom. inval.)]
MFAKPAKPSGSSLLKTKDAKKLRKDAAVRFGCDDALVLAFAPTKSDVRKVSFQAPSRVVVYVAEDAREPVLFDASGKGELCPTVYALWRAAAVLPALVVHAPVSEFVLRGADVMLPGVVFSSMEELAALRKGELRAVVARGNPMPFAVGELLVDDADVERNGKKGRALRLLHYVGDELWQMGPKTFPNEGFLGARVVPIDAGGTAQDSADNNDDSGDVETTVSAADDGKGDAGLTVEHVMLEEKPRVLDDAESDAPTLTTHEMDAAFVATLLQVLKTPRVREKELPMLASTFQASVFLPSRPAGLSLNVKQSSFKKTSAFLRAMQARGLLAVAEKDGPAFVPGQYAPEIDEFLGLPASVKAMFLRERAHAATHFAVVAEQKHWRAADVRELVAKYIELQQLVDPRDKKFVRLDGPLTDALYGKNVPAGGYPQRLARPDVAALLLAKCQKFHRVTLFPGHAARIVGGELRPIAVHAERSKAHASSVTTTVAFYQPFGIDGARFAKEAQKKWGCSATTQPSADKSKGEEIRVQGQMVNEVLDLLAVGYRINTTKCCAVSYGKNVKPKKRT